MYLLLSSRSTSWDVHNARPPILDIRSRLKRIAQIHPCSRDRSSTNRCRRRNANLQSSGMLYFLHHCSHSIWAMYTVDIQFGILSLSLRTLIILDCTVPGYTACHHRADDTIISKTSPMTNDMPTNVDRPMHTVGIIDVGQHSMRLSGENGIWWKTPPPQAPDHTFERDEDTSWRWMVGEEYGCDGRMRLATAISSLPATFVCALCTCDIVLVSTQNRHCGLRISSAPKRDRA